MHVLLENCNTPYAHFNQICLISDTRGRKRQSEKDKIEGNKKKIEWGSQIRNYVLHPYKMVKDVRTEVETTDSGAVLDGNIDLFLKSYLMSNN